MKPSIVPIEIGVSVAGLSIQLAVLHDSTQPEDHLDEAILLVEAARELIENPEVASEEE